MDSLFNKKYVTSLRLNDYKAWHEVRRVVAFVHEIIQNAESACEDTAVVSSLMISDLIVRYLMSIDSVIFLEEG